MSFVIAAPEMMTAAATDLATIGSNVSAAHMAAAAPTVAVIPAAADEVSASIAHLFSGFAQDYQALAGQAAAFNQQFVQHLTASAGSFASAEAANASLLQPLTASAASIGSTISDVAGNLINMLAGLFTNLQTLLSELYAVLNGVILAAYLALVVVGLSLLFGLLLIEFALSHLFGITIPIPSLP